MEKVQELTQLLKRLNSGEDPVSVKEQAKDFLSTVNACDLSIAEQQLMDEGLSAADLQNLCTAHLQMIGDQVDKMKASLPPGHVISTLVSEHETILCFLDELWWLNERIGEMAVYDPESDKFRKISHIAKHLVAAELHYQREEEILFPALEERGVYGPTAIMKEEHIQLMEKKHELENLTDDVSKMDFEDFKYRFDDVIKFIVPTLRDHISKENNILYPTALEVIEDESVWTKLKEECDKIGYCCFAPPEN
jgi:DUF438 domain-containing protein